MCKCCKLHLERREEISACVCLWFIMCKICCDVSCQNNLHHITYNRSVMHVISNTTYTADLWLWKRPVSYTHMLLPIRKDLPEAREELNPGPLSQRCGDVTKLDQSVQKGPRLKPHRKNYSCWLSNLSCPPEARVRLIYHSTRWLNSVWLMCQVWVGCWFYSLNKNQQWKTSAP